MKFTAKKARKRRKNTRKRFKGGTPPKDELPPLPLALIEFEELAKNIKKSEPGLNFQEGEGQSYAGHLVFHILNEHNRIDLQHLGDYIEHTYNVPPKVSFFKKWFKKTPTITPAPPPFPLSNPMIYGDFVYKITGFRSKYLWARPRTFEDTLKHILTLVKTFIEKKRDPTINKDKGIDPDPNPNSEYKEILYINSDDY